MPTELRKPVTRRTVDTHGHRRRKLIVRLEPGDIIAFREEKCRAWFTAPLSRVFQQVVAWNVYARKAQAKEKKS